MKKTVLLTIILCLGSTVCGTLALAQGYMAFGTTATKVTGGEAGSYMRAGLDWDGTPGHVIAGVAVPTLLSPATIETRNDGTSLYLTFSIKDRTRTQDPGGATLACGDQVIVQIDPTNSKAATLNTNVNKFIRYEVVIKDNAFVGGQVKKRLPLLDAGDWIWNPSEETPNPTTHPALSPLNAGASQYDFTLRIPLADINNPTGNIGLAIALINDLGHSHGNPAIPEASGTAFPLSMGLTPESEPGLNCGAQPTGVTASGNWIAPSTWGTGYKSLAAVPPTVTLSQTPGFSLSNSIRLGNCSAQWADIAPVQSYSNWEAVQQNTANNWYLYNPTGPCRMAIWVNAYVSGTGIVKKRFFVMWGRPGISPQNWYVAGLTSPVPIAGPSTPVSFIWYNPPPVTFSSHPCLKVYVLPETITAADSTNLMAITTETQRLQMESTYGVAIPQIAQMNFANIGSGSCTNQACAPLSARDPEPSPRITFASTKPLAPAGIPNALQQTTGRDDRQPGRKDSVEQRIRVIAHGVGVAAPGTGKPYVYVEPIGALGWSIPTGAYADSSLALDFGVTNPKVVETAFVGGQRVDIPAPPRRILIALVTDVPAGVRAPKLDVTAFKEYGDRLVQPGDTATTQVVLSKAGWIPPIPWWAIALIILLLLLILFLRSRARP